MIQRHNPFRRMSVFIASATALAVLMAIASFYLIGVMFQ